MTARAKRLLWLVVNTIRLSAKLHFNKLNDKEQNGNLVENNDCRSWATIEKFDI